MTAPVFLLESSELDTASHAAVIEVGGDEGRHGGAVRRLRSGEICHLVDGAGRRVTGSVIDSDRSAFRIEVLDVRDEPEPTPRIVVVQALAKGDRAESAVEMLTECGVDVIVPWSAGRSVSVWRGDKAERGVQRWRAVGRAATKQSRRSRLPAILDLHDSRAVADLIAGADLAIVLHEAADEPLTAATDLSGLRDVVIVVGPEGGISDEELALFRDAGARVVGLGPTVLRTSTAGVVAAGVLSAASGRWERR